ncbi:MAG: hypothetical protein K0R17_2195 [Rariglobus sp.]|jgi:hypothetical protein|nr:hypothetical protein [Rariglobus sp.]
MKRLLPLLLGLCSFLPLSAQGLKLSLSEKGAVLNAGTLGSFSLPAPSIDTTDKKELKPTYALNPEGGGAQATYSNGFVLKIAVSNADKSVTYSFDTPPKNGASLKFVTFFPINLSQGGRFALGAKSGEFPAAKAGQFLAQGDSTTFDVIHPLGEGVRFTVPAAFQQLQDNRTWGWNVFAWVYRYDLKRYAGKTSFSFRISSLAATPAAAGAPAAPRFLVDRFGQSARKDYPGKVKSEDELKADIAVQQAALGAYQGPALDKFGGLAGSGQKLGLKATGFFHTALIGKDRHVLVTPEGNAFFQLGVCGIANTDDFTLVKGREKIYEWLPPAKDEQWKTAWRNGRPDWGIFSFQIANWIRKYGKPYSFEEWTGQTVDRLRAWGFNSAGAFGGHVPTFRTLNFPSVSFLPSGKEQGVSYLPDKVGAADLIDPFGPGIEEALDKAFSGSIAKRADDPLLIGYFLGNEQHFELLPKLIPSYKASKVPAKAKLVGILAAKYGDIAKFNAAWAPVKPFASFDDLNEEPLFIKTDAASADMRAFYQLYLETYYSLIRRTFKKYDQNHLLIGSRWTPHTANNEDVVRIGGKYLDVVSINYYTYGIEKDFLKKVYDWSGGKPMLFSEWYYSSTERGLGGGKEVKDQVERGLGYRNYIEQSAATGYVVGSQWFVYTDQSITGRFFSGFNGEGNNTGIVDVADRPYQPLVDAARVTHARIYDVILGKETAFAYDDARFTGKGAGPAKIVSIPPSLPGLQLNGSTTDWPGRPAEPIGANRVMIGNPNPKLGGDFRLCWDDKALHFLIQVKDPTPGKNNKSPKSYWSGDGIELFIGAKNLNEGGTLQFSDRQILIGTGEAPGVFIVDHPEAGKDCSVVVVKDVSGDGYTVQVRLPWTVLGFEPKTGLEMLFDVAIDNSDDGDARLQQLVWSGTGKNSGDRGAWGRARLVEN